MGEGVRQTHTFTAGNDTISVWRFWGCGGKPGDSSGSERYTNHFSGCQPARAAISATIRTGKVGRTERLAGGCIDYLRENRCFLTKYVHSRTASTGGRHSKGTSGSIA